MVADKMIAANNIMAADNMTLPDKITLLDNYTALNSITALHITATLNTSLDDPWEFFNTTNISFPDPTPEAPLRSPEFNPQAAMYMALFPMRIRRLSTEPSLEDVIEAIL